MRRLQAVTTPLSHLSYRGSLPKARRETGFYRETARLDRFSEEVYRIPLGDSSSGDEPRQLCVSRDESIHLLSVGNQSFGLVSYFSERDGRQQQEERLHLSLGDSLPGGGGWGTQLRCFGPNQLALFLPTWDTVFLFGPEGGRCDTIRLGKNNSAFSARKARAAETLMFSNQGETELFFCGTDAVRVMVDGQLLTVGLPTNTPCVIRPVGNEEFLVEKQLQPGSQSGSRLALLSKIGKGSEWLWQPISIENVSDDAREWSIHNKLARTPSSYFQTLRPHGGGSHQDTFWNVHVSRRTSPSAPLFGKWSSSRSVLASISLDSTLLEVVDFATQRVRTIEIPPLHQTEKSEVEGSVAAKATRGETVDSIVVSESSMIYLLSSTQRSTFEDGSRPRSLREFSLRVFDPREEQLEKDLNQWRRLWGLPPGSSKWKTIQDDARGDSLESKTPPKASSPKHGKIDDLFHAGGNTFAGGTGGSDTAGLGGRGGPYRLDKGHQVHQISDELKQQVDKEVLERARQLGKIAWEERLKEIQMNSNAHRAYMEARNRVEADLDRLKAVLETSSMRKKERHWERNQSFGELDDSRLVDGLVGERLIYKRRVLKEPPLGASPSSALNVRIVVDVSASMYRFQSMDGRLQRMIDTTLMLLEAMEGLNHRFRVSIYGHSGESPAVPLVEWDQVPQDEGGIYKVLESMAAHAQYCISGDHTVEAIFSAVEAVLDEDSENGGLVIVVSDANLRRYGIAPSEVAKAMCVSEKVKAHVIFVASVRDEAETLVRELPFGKAKVCLETSDLPHVMRDILSDASQGFG